MSKVDQFFHKRRWRDAELEVLDGDLTRSDLVTVLRQLKFDEHYCLIGLDRPVRDYLVAALDARRK
jgi:hypothetical protein